MSLDLKAVAARLQQRLAEIDAEDAAASGAADPVALDQEAVGRLSRMDAMQQQAMAMASRERRRQARDRIIMTLRRLDDPEFGYCITCGDAIAVARLMNDPTVTQCVACASERAL